MKFPIFQISNERWNAVRELDVEYSDEITMISNKKLKNFFLFSEYIDCNGDVFKITEIHETSILSRIVRFIPQIPFKVKLNFTKLNRNLNLEQFRTIVLNRVNEVSDYGDYKFIIKNARTYSEIMGEQS
jgi:hypothetical protein